MEPAKPLLRRCAVYTRKSSEEGLEQNFNSLHAQREACEAFIKSQASEGWRLVKTHYDDGGLSGASIERPALQRLLGDIRQGLIEVVAVYKVDRLTRSLTDFAKIVEQFDAHQVSFVAVTQQFIYGPLPCAPSLVKGLSSDDPVAFIYPASLMGFSKLARGLDGNPRTLSSINTAAS
jgi:DNA invertase Pin-like site-specific DNA recombinase